MANGGGPVDVVLVGGGLANLLIALRLKLADPHRRVVLLEQAPGPVNAHTWSFFETDVPETSRGWLRPVLRSRWPGYDVRFPTHDRQLATSYCSVDEQTLAASVARILDADLRYGSKVSHLEPNRVSLADGTSLEAPLVIDGRGAQASAHLWLAWQKFRGVELRTKRPHGLERPILMDATVRQLDGYRFLYVLPFDEQTLLVEDTRYSDTPALDAHAVEAEALRYARASGWCVGEVLRRETGVLPIALGGDLDAYWAEQPAEAPVVGLRGAFFHPTTGYSLADAVAVAEAIAASPRLESATIRKLVEARSKRLWAERSFYRGLNRMMFLAAEPASRWQVLARFYRMPQPLIERFYAGRSTLADRARLVVGKPPVPALPAIKALIARSPAREAA